MTINNEDKNVNKPWGLRMDMIYAHTILRNQHALIEHEHVLSGFGFRSEKSFLKKMLPENIMKKQWLESKEKLQKNIFELCEFIEKEATIENAEDLLKNIYPHQFKFTKFNYKYNLNINPLLQSSYVSHMKVFHEDLFYTNQLVIIKSLEKKLNRTICYQMSKKEVVNQYNEICEKMNPSQIVELIYEDETPSNNSIRKKRKL